MFDIKCLDQAFGDNWALYQGDNVELAKAIPDNSIHFQVFSPAFEAMYIWSNSPRDMGNCSNSQEYSDHYRFLIKEQFRIHKPGRLLAMHCMQIPTAKSREGYIGIKDFRGDLIRLYQSEGWIYHSEVCIWKNAEIASARTHSVGLSHKRMVQDSAISRQGLADYIVVMRKPGDNEEPIGGRITEWYGEDKPKTRGTLDKDSQRFWSRYASPVWMDIDPSDTLNFRTAKENKDEKHLCATQLTPMRRCIQLWTNPGDIVLDPFNGIGTTGYVALDMDRRYVGFEIKKSYFNCSINNFRNLQANSQLTLFEIPECA